MGRPLVSAGKGRPSGLQHDVYMAVVSRDAVGLKQLLDTHPSFRCDFSLKGRHVLALAVEKGDLDTVRLLLGAGAPPHPDPPPAGGKDPPVPVRSQMPVCIAIRLNMWLVFEELASRGWGHDPRPLVAAGWECLVERRPRMLGRLVERVGGGVLLQQLLLRASGPTGEQAGARKFLARCLPLLVTSDLPMAHWRIRVPTPDEGWALPTDQRALVLLAAAGCQVTRHCHDELDAPLHQHFQPTITFPLHYYSSFSPPRPLQDLVRSFIREHLTRLVRYSALCRRLESGDGGASDVARQLGLPLALLSFVFMVDEREEFLRCRDEQMLDRLELNIRYL